MSRSAVMALWAIYLLVNIATAATSSAVTATAASTTVLTPTVESVTAKTAATSTSATEDAPDCVDCPPPKNFPKGKAVPFNPDKLPTMRTPVEGVPVPALVPTTAAAQASALTTPASTQNSSASTQNSTASAPAENSTALSPAENSTASAPAENSTVSATNSTVLVTNSTATAPKTTALPPDPTATPPDPTATAPSSKDGHGSIHACELPAPNAISASSWLADTGNVTKVCHLHLKWLHSATPEGKLRVCTLPHGAWNSSYTVTDGSIRKELLAQLDTSGVQCVTPREALSNSSSGEGGGAGAGSLPSAWLRDNNTIYIYIIPQEWLRGADAPGDNATATDDPLGRSSGPSPTPKDTTAPPKEKSTKPNLKPKAAPTKPTQNPKTLSKTTESTTIASTKVEEIVTKKASDETTVKPTEMASSVSPSDAENEIAHGNRSLKPPEALSQQHSEHDHASTGKTAFLQPTQSAAILAGVFVSIALLGYVGLLLWRRVLEKKYGNREMLVNEDDDFATGDMRHFEL